MINTHKGDLLSVNEGVILHQVNCQGVMNSGVAKAIRDKYPKVYVHYMYRYNNNNNPLLGGIQLIDVTDSLSVINIYGQREYGRENLRYTSYDALDRAFSDIATIYRKERTSFHFPLIGCGLGGGKWPIVQAIIEHHLNKHELHLWVP